MLRSTAVMNPLLSMHIKQVVAHYAFPVIAIGVFLIGVGIFLTHTLGVTWTLSQNSTNLTQAPKAYTPRSADALRRMSLTEQTDHWHSAIAALGGEAAYETFHETYEGIDANEQHAAAHVFGGELYAVEGVEGFSVCDLQYSYGCYHEFLGQAIFHEGMPVVDVLNQGCHDDLASVGQELSCQHGIGHGVLAAIGYETEMLPEALEVCNELPYADPIGGCYGGVFMEYNLRTMLVLDGVPPRERESDNLLEPCRSMPEYSKAACYYWQPQWWGVELRAEGVQSDLERHTIMGELCNSIGDDDLRDYCVKGIGNNLITIGTTPEDAIVLCQAATSDLRTEVLCRSDAANSFFTMPTMQNRASDTCTGLTGTYYEYCYAHSINTMNLVNEGTL